jgi:predicted DNA-binding transcriptional regulator AlpA
MTCILDNLPADLARHRILNTAQAAAFRGVSVMTWRRLYRAKKVPDPIQISPGKYGWKVGDLIDMDAKRAA